MGSKFSSNTGNTSTPSGSPIPGATSAGGPPKRWHYFAFVLSYFIRIAFFKSTIFQILAYYTAIAHSMAQLRKIPIGQPRNYGFRPSQFSSAAASKTNGNGGGTAPYRYFNYLETAASNRRSRVLSPEPMESGQSGALRHSNLQSRSYFHGGASSHRLPTITTMNDSSSDKYGGGGNGRIPYRQRGPSNSISTLFDGFASVRRKRMDELTSLGQFEATSELLRSLSPPVSFIFPREKLIRFSQLIRPPFVHLFL